MEEDQVSKLLTSHRPPITTRARITSTETSPEVNLEVEPMECMPALRKGPGPLPELSTILPPITITKIMRSI